MYIQGGDLMNTSLFDPIGQILTYLLIYISVNYLLCLIISTPIVFIIIFINSIIHKNKK